jgi:hypothetical protein
MMRKTVFVVQDALLMIWVGIVLVKMTLVILPNAIIRIMDVYALILVHVIHI